MNIKTRKFKVLVGVFLFLILLRAFLPQIGKHYLNNYLAEDVENYVGHIEDFDLSLWRGAYQLEGLELKKKNTKESTPFVSVKEMDISLSWKALFRGRFLIDLVLDEPVVNFTDSKKKENQQFGVDNKAQTWQELLNTLVPFRMESLVIDKGTVSFQNHDFKVPVIIKLSSITLDARNIHNSKKQKGNLFSTYNLKAIAEDHAPLQSKGSFNILSEPLDFDMSLSLEKFKITELNHFAKLYGPLDITSGEFNFYMELAAYQGALKGYLKPMAKNMDVRDGSKEKDDSIKEFFIEILMAFSNLILQNNDNKNFAAKIPVEGKITNPQIDTWAAIKSAFRNGFGGEKLKNQVDEEITLKSAIGEKQRQNSKKD